VRSELLRCRCEAPNGDAYIDHMRSWLTTRPRLDIPQRPLPDFWRRLHNRVGPVALESWGALVVAEAMAS
jgi:hypothetical protein